MRSALAVRILLSIKILRNAYILSYFSASLIAIAILSSYFSTSVFCRVIASSYLQFFGFLFPVLCCSFFKKSRGKNSCHDESSQVAECVEDLGGKGPRVAAYLRVSTSRQAKEGFSLEAQREQLNKLKNEIKPSRIYWFVDAGKSGVDFDKRKINSILKLKDRGELDELWVTSIDRIGRECRKMLYFFLEFCDDGAIIRTPEKQYVLEDLSSFLIYVIEAHTSEQANRSRAKAAIAGKAQSFKKKHWNKPTPFGYRKRGKWLIKIPELGSITEEIYKRFLRTKCLERVRKYINAKYRQHLSEPLSRYRIRRILSDPIYVGKPEHLGEIVVDASLAYIDEDAFLASLKILEDIREKYKPNRVSPIEELVATYGISALEFLDQLGFHHKSCGGPIVMNGTDEKSEPRQQIFLCRKCRKQWKVPTKAQLRRIQGVSSQGNIKSSYCSSGSDDSIFPLTYESDSFPENFKETEKPKKHKKREKELGEKARNATLDELFD